jgi:neutral trehalase
MVKESIRGQRDDYLPNTITSCNKLDSKKKEKKKTNLAKEKLASRLFRAITNTRQFSLSKLYKSEAKKHGVEDIIEMLKSNKATPEAVKTKICTDVKSGSRE